MSYSCPNRQKEYNKKYRQEHREEANVYSRKYRVSLFKKVIKGYGGKCLFCDENRPKALLLHHTNEDGKNHRKSTGKGLKFYRWIINNNFPDNISLLCGTCHLIHHRTGEWGK